MSITVHEDLRSGVSDARPQGHTRFELLAVPKADNSDLGTEAVPATYEAELKLLADGEFPLKSDVEVACVAKWAFVRSASVGPSAPPSGSR